MGVPRFLIEILKKYKNTHFVNTDFVYNTFFMDYNAFIHNTVKGEYFKQTTYEKFEKLTSLQKDKEIANFVVQRTLEYINTQIKPTNTLYIAFDGPVPFAKMKLQRARRYQGIMDKSYLQELSDIFSMPPKTESLWSSGAISPGTVFMEKVAEGLEKAASSKKFMKGKIRVIIDNTSIAGEGEHKIIHYIKKQNPSGTIGIYSPDADMPILSMQLHNDVYCLQPYDPIHKKEHIELYPDIESGDIVFSLNIYKDVLYKEFPNISMTREELSKDIMFLTLFIGNDFVPNVPFFKSTDKWALSTIVNIYKNIIHKYKHQDIKSLIYIQNEKVQIHVEMFTEILQNMANMEDGRMKGIYKNLLRNMSENEKKEEEEKEDSFEIRKGYFEHEMYYSKKNPNAEPELFTIIDYNKQHNEWKKEYYQHFLDFTTETPQEIRNCKKEMCKEYLKILVFTVNYYYNELPSWKFYYSYRVAPMPSDILYFMREMPNNLDFSFEKGESYTPLEQLALITPPHDMKLLPKVYQEHITNPKSPLFPFYPIHCKLDKLVGGKHIYAKPMLPPFVHEIVDPFIKKLSKKFTKTEQKRNILQTEYYEYKN